MLNNHTLVVAINSNNNITLIYFSELHTMNTPFLLTGRLIALVLLHVDSATLFEFYLLIIHWEGRWNHLISNKIPSPSESIKKKKKKKNTW